MCRMVHILPMLLLPFMAAFGNVVLTKDDQVIFMSHLKKVSENGGGVFDYENIVRKILGMGKRPYDAEHSPLGIGPTIKW